MIYPGGRQFGEIVVYGDPVTASVLFIAGAAIVGGVSATLEEQARQADVQAQYDMTETRRDVALSQAEFELAQAEAAAELAGGQAGERYQAQLARSQRQLDLLLDQTRRNYELGIEENVAQQGEFRTQVNRQAVQTRMEGAQATGAATAGAATSGVRNTGSAANIRSEAERYYRVDLDQLDADMETRIQGFGRERGRMAEARAQAEETAQEQYASTTEQAGLMYEHTAESILGRDLDMEDILAGTVDWTEGTFDDTYQQTVSGTNEIYNEELAYLEGQKGDEMDEFLAFLGGAVEGALSAGFAVL